MMSGQNFPTETFMAPLRQVAIARALLTDTPPDSRHTCRLYARTEVHGTPFATCVRGRGVVTRHILCLVTHFPMPGHVTGEPR
jgi:hypothetical protein